MVSREDRPGSRLLAENLQEVRDPREKGDGKIQQEAEQYAPVSPPLGSTEGVNFYEEIVFTFTSKCDIDND
ncbi:hypothetical protein KL86DPRO_70109 [uncultured delta proteobacterium]|uniref:Uncharacterized protein n=1 Tax=uncultured delta proteobacterium TaxID=34034 RepID=A0A212KH42_9DELT|nr:hypothetical protein KL86DPRO_70109 [uncultured delta proteobacterium]